MLWFFLPILLIVSSWTVVWFSSPSAAQTPPPRQEIRGVWMTANDKDVMRDRTKLRDAVTKLRQLNFNTIYPVVWNSGYALYPSTVTRTMRIQSFVYEGTQGQDTLADLVNQSHRQGLLVIPWFEFGFMTPLSSELAMMHPDWLTRQQNGQQTSISAAGEVAWLNPFLPAVQDFIASLVLEIVTRYNVDGIQFDDHMSLPHTFGYDPYTLALYTQETQKVPLSPNDPDWVKWRADKITAFMSRLHQSVKARRPRAIFSIAPNYYDFAYKLHLQDWLTWVRQNLVDELIVQVYRPDLISFFEQLDRPEVQEAKLKIPTGIGILTGLRNNPVPMNRVQSQVQVSIAQGLGVAFFYYESLWEMSPESAQIRQDAFRSLFPSPALRSAVR